MTESTPNVYLYIPNLIGYARVFSLLYGLAIAFEDHYGFIFCYAASQLLDAFDGMAARKFNQCSLFGAVLDMVTDRCSSSALLMILAMLYKDFYLIFIVLFLLDFMSHWVSMYASASDKSVRSHKTQNEDAPWILRLYYTNKIVLFLVCASQELTYMSLYCMAMAKSTDPLSELYVIAFQVSLPLTFFKQIANVVQLKNGCDDIVARDVEEWKKKQ